jgi:hypothetical protein
MNRLRFRRLGSSEGGSSVVVTAPITGDGSPASPLAISAATETAAGSLSASDKTKLDRLVADWTAGLASPRYFAVDSAAGSNSNLGYSDTSMAAAGALAVQTLAQLRLIVPTIGAGRTLVIAIKGTFAEDLVLQLQGYARILVRATADFVNTATEKVVCGGTTKLAGPNGNGSFSVIAGATTTLFTTSGAVTLTAEPALLGKRVRFATGALAGVCCTIEKNTGTAITPDATLAGAPALGDTFFIEEPGVTVQRVVIEGTGSSESGTSTATTSISIAGIASTSTSADAWSVCGPHTVFEAAFCEQRGSSGHHSAVSASRVPCRSSCDAPTLTKGARRAPHVEAGSKGRSSSGGDLRDLVILVAGAVGWSRPVSSCASSSHRYSRAAAHGHRCSYRTVGGLATTAGGSNTVFSAVGNNGSSTLCRARINNAGITVQQSSRGPSVASKLSTSGANAAVVMQGLGCALAVDDLIGSTGNTGVVVDLSTGIGNQVALGTVTAITAIASGGDINLAGGAVATFAGLATTNVIDSAGNNVQGSGGAVVGPCRRYTNKDGTALAIGEIVRVSAAGQVVRAQADTSAHNDGPLFVSVTPPANNAEGLLRGDERPAQMGPVRRRRPGGGLARVRLPGDCRRRYRHRPRAGRHQPEAPHRATWWNSGSLGLAHRLPGAPHRDQRRGWPHE